VDLAELVDERVQLVRRRHPDDHLRLVAPDEPLLVHGWPEGLVALVDNLLVNALAHGRRGDAPVRVEVQLSHDAAGVRLSVADDGPGIPPAERTSAFERFRRGAGSAAGGTGLGLALVAQQAALHQGSVVITDADGGGTRVVAHLRGVPPPGVT
jgi:two-component system sensor histidine kinase PrrB